jgi:hypothetical protein
MDSETESHAGNGVFHLIGASFERSSGWMHVIAAICAFTTEVLKPLLHHFTLTAVVIALVAIGIIYPLIRKGWIAFDVGAAALVFFITTFICSTALLAAEAVSGDPPEGVLAHEIPPVRDLQQWLRIVDQRTQRIEAKTDRILQIVTDQHTSKPSAIAQHISGQWGEGDCSQVSYAFSKVGDALTIESAKRPDNAAAYRFVGTIIKDSDLSMEVRGEEPDSAKGLSATFEYESNGVTERLHWQDHVSGGTDVELNRCG